MAKGSVLKPQIGVDSKNENFSVRQRLESVSVWLPCYFLPSIQMLFLFFCVSNSRGSDQRRPCKYTGFAQPEFQEFDEIPMRYETKISVGSEALVLAWSDDYC